jgi:hypothetical protein
LRLITFLIFLAPLFWGCGNFNRPLEPFIEKHTAEVSIESVRFRRVYPPGSDLNVFPNSNVVDPNGETEILAVINLENPANLALDFSLSQEADDSGMTAILGRADNRRVEVRIGNVGIGKQIELRLNAKAETNRTFRLSVPAAFNSALTVTLPSTPVDGTGTPVAHWVMQTPSAHPGIDKVVITYRNRNTYPEFVTETYGWDESLNSGSGGLTNAYGHDPAGRNFSNAGGMCNLDFPYGSIPTPVEDYCSFSVAVYDRFGLSASAATPGFFAAKTGGKSYETLNAAVNAAGAGSAANPAVIELLEDINFPEPNSGTYMISGKHIKLTVPQNQTKTVRRTTATSGAFFIVAAGSSLTLARNGTGQLVLDGGGSAAQTIDNYNDRPTVAVAGGELRMEAGTVIKNNYANKPAVHVTNGGNFIMDGGEISDNKQIDINNWDGGGVIVAGSGSSFTMNGGEIKNNTGYKGGGVRVAYGASFTINDGEIKDNTATAGGNGWLGQGGGVLVEDSVFIMTDGEISGNSVDDTGSATNEEKRGGGGVFVKSGTFTLRGGNIRGNTIPADPEYNGKGVLIEGGTFKMEDAAAIHANNDVYLNTGKTITITGSLTGGIGTVATITPDTYTLGRQILTGTFVAGNYNRFAVTSSGAQLFTIDSDGKLIE